MDFAQEKIYTLKDIYALPDGQRAELIDGQIYDMGPPTTLHQRVVFRLAASINDHIKKKNGSCEVFVSPFAFFLNADDKNYVEPDISVICNKDHLSENGYHGAPDWVAEIASPSTERMDYGIKLFKYRTAGVREYWKSVIKCRKETNHGKSTALRHLYPCFYRRAAPARQEPGGTSHR